MRRPRNLFGQPGSADELMPGLSPMALGNVVWAGGKATSGLAGETKPALAALIAKLRALLGEAAPIASKVARRPPPIVNLGQMNQGAAEFPLPFPK